MYSVKPGRGPSIIGGIGSIVVGIFGIVWIGAAVEMRAPAVFPLFGVVFVLAAIGGAIYNFYNAGARERLSEHDIVHHSEEGDPVARALGHEPEALGNSGAAEPKPRRFAGDYCPFCGVKVEPHFDYCPKCGKDI